MTPLLLHRLVDEAASNAANSCLVCDRQHFDGKRLHCSPSADFPVYKLTYGRGLHFQSKASACRYYRRFPDATKEVEA